jgi:YD repeat-containing protein
MKTFNNSQSTYLKTPLSLSHIIKNGCHLIKKSLTYSGVLLALAACDASIEDSTSTNHTMKTSPQVGKLQAKLQLAPDMKCHTFNLINEDLGTQELSVDLTQARFINGKYAFRRALKEGEYNFIGELNCTNANQQAINYESFPEFVTITTQESANISFDFIFNRATDLDSINLQLCAELILASLSHGDQACLGDEITANYDIRWLTEQSQCQDLTLEMSLNQQFASTEALQHNVPNVSISIPADELMSIGSLEISLNNQEGGRISLYRQSLEVVECSDETPLENDPEPSINPLDPNQGSNQDNHALVRSHEQLEKFLALENNPFQSCGEQNLVIESSSLFQSEIINFEDTHNTRGQILQSRSEFSNDSNQFDFSYDEFDRLTEITYSYTNQDNLVETMSYDDNGRPLELLIEYIDSNISSFHTNFEHIYNLNQKVVHTHVSNRLSQEIWSYSYNNEGQLVEIELEENELEDNIINNPIFLTSIEYKYDANNRIISEDQVGLPIKEDLIRYHFTSISEQEIEATHSTYEYLNGLRYKFTTFFAHDELSDENTKPIGHLIEVIDLNHNPLHFELRNEFGELISLYTTNFNQDGQLTATETINTFKYPTVMYGGYNIFINDINLIIEEKIITTVSSLTCE